MRRFGFVLGACLALTVGPGCGGSDGGGNNGGGNGGFASTLQGTWASCETDGTASAKLAFTFSGSNVTIALASWNANSTCTGTPDFQAGVSGTFTVGSAVTANLGATPVTAHQIDVTSGGSTQYDLVYVDTAANPDRLYLGDSSGANDGSTPALRPTALDDTFYLQKQ
jgi:hypothetical protein